MLLSSSLDISTTVSSSATVLGVGMIDPRSFRLKAFLAVASGAVLIAALLRHVLHVYGGLSREEIRWDALFFAIVGVLAVSLYRRFSKR
jgi:hypothetical protein